MRTWKSESKWESQSLSQRSGWSLEAHPFLTLGRGIYKISTVILLNNNLGCISNTILHWRTNHYFKSWLKKCTLSYWVSFADCVLLNFPLVFSMNHVLSVTIISPLKNVDIMIYLICSWTRFYLQLQFLF